MSTEIVVGLTTLGVLLLSNIGALLWGASRITTTVRFLGETQKEMAKDLRDISMIVADHARQLASIHERHRMRDRAMGER